MLCLYFLRDIKRVVYKNMQPKLMVICGYTPSDGKMGSYEVHFQMCGDGDDWGGPWPTVVAKGVLTLTKAGFGGK